MAPNTSATDQTAGNASSGARAHAQGMAVGTGPLTSGAEMAVGAAVAGPAPCGRRAPQGALAGVFYGGRHPL